MRKTSKRILANAHAGISDVARGREYHQLRAALVDVVLRTVGRNPRRLRDDLDVGLERIDAATQVVGLHFDDQPGFAVVERRRLLFADLEPLDLRTLMVSPEHQPVWRFTRI